MSLLLDFSSLYATPIAEEFKQKGYVEIQDRQHGVATYDSLYACFDEFITFFQKNPKWVHKLYHAKERFIRSKDQLYYSTNFFGLYDESERKGKNQISFYYSSHFHAFICSRFPEFNQVPEIIRFFEACFEIQRAYGTVFEEAAAALNVGTIFSSEYGLLFKVIKYLPSYSITKPHYDGTAFSLFLDSTNNESLLLSPYKESFVPEDFSSATREFPRGSSILLIPGTFLTEFSIYPTPHLVLPSGKIRYATIAFAMRPGFHPKAQAYTPFTSLALNVE